MGNKYTIEGLKCQGCVNVLKNKLLEIDNLGVNDININLENKELVILKNIDFSVVKNKIKETKFNILE